MADKTPVILKGNDLINARYALTKTEMRLVLCAIAQIQPEDEDFKDYVIDTRDYTELTGSQSKGESTRLRSITLGLMRKPIEIPVEDGYVQVGFISYAKYRHNESKVIIRFDPAMKPYLLQLKKRFTSYRLEYVMQLQSYYSIRLYEMLKESAGAGRRIMNLEELHDILQTPASYRRFGSFRQRVLDVAQHEINEKTDLTVRYDLIKDGRTVVDVIFFIDVTGDALVEGLGNATIALRQDLMDAFDLSMAQVERLFSEYDEAYLRAAIERLEPLLASGQVRNRAAFALNAIENGEAVLPAVRRHMG